MLIPNAIPLKLLCPRRHDWGQGAAAPHIERARRSSPLAAVRLSIPRMATAAPSVPRSTRATRCGGTWRGWRPR